MTYSKCYCPARQGPKKNLRVDDALPAACFLNSPVIPCSTMSHLKSWGQQVTAGLDRLSRRELVSGLLVPLLLELTRLSSLSWAHAHLLSLSVETPTHNDKSVNRGIQPNLALWAPSFWSCVASMQQALEQRVKRYYMNDITAKYIDWQDATKVTDMIHKYKWLHSVIKKDKSELSSL